MRKAGFTSDDHLYQQVADGLEKMIADDVLQDRRQLPSVRIVERMNTALGMGTAFPGLLSSLEGKGLVESRPNQAITYDSIINDFPSYRE